MKKQAKQQIVVDRIANDRQVEIDPNELYQSIFEIAQMYGVDPMQMLQDQNQVAAMGQDLRRNRALVTTLREVTVKDEDAPNRRPKPQPRRPKLTKLKQLTVKLKTSRSVKK